MAKEKTYQENCEQALIRCARVCCVCRRFRPSHIQVHHIIERGDGGTDELDNLIPVCIFCHQGHVHAKVPFTQRFSAAELKGLRDAVYALVGQGRLVPSDGDADTSINRVDEPALGPEQQLSNEARELLLEAVKDSSGQVIKVRTSGGLTVQTNKKNLVTAPHDARCQALWEGAVDELVEHDLIADVGYEGKVFGVTRTGFGLADRLAQNG